MATGFSLSFSPESGEGHITKSNRQKLENMFNYGGLFAADVIGDWKGELEFAYDRARIIMSAEYDAVPTTEARSAAEVAMEIIQMGYKRIHSGLVDAYIEHSGREEDDEFIEEMKVITKDADRLREIIDAAAKAKAEEIIGFLSTVEDFDEHAKDRDYESKIHIAVAAGMLQKGKAGYAQSTT